MPTSLPPSWAQSKEVPTKSIQIRGIRGDVVATIEVTGDAKITTAYPYSSRVKST
jgi:hypothetical protein